MLYKYDLPTLLSLALVFAAGTRATNYFTEPGTQPGQSYAQGTTLTVRFSTDFKEPHLRLYCGNINNRN